MDSSENRPSVFDRIRALNFPMGKYIVVGGVLEVHGIRPANDIDIVVPRKFFEELAEKPEYQLMDFTYPDDRKNWLKGDGVDIMPGFSYNDLYRPVTEELIANADIIDGLPFIPLKELMKWKKAANREKDQRDVILIEAYLTQRQDDNTPNLILQA